MSELNQPAAFDRIRRVLNATRRRLRIATSLRGAGWLTVAAGAALLLAVGVGAVGAGTWWRLPGWVLVGLAALAAVFVAWARPLWRSRGDDAVAAHLEGGVPELRDGLLACVQFERQWPHDTPGSPTLVAALADAVAQHLESAELSPVTPLRPERRMWRALGGVVLAWAVLGVFAPAGVQRGWAVLSPRANSGGARRTGPLVGDLVVELRHPAYTGRPDRIIPNSAGDIEAPAGTRVSLRATTLKPARLAWIRFDGGEQALALREGREVSGEFVLERAGTWRFGVEDTRGDALIEDLDRHLRVEADRPPTVTLSLPAEDLELEDLRAVAVAFEARDDFGLSKANVVVALAADPDHPERVEQPGASGLRFSGADEIDLRVIQAAPGDRIALYVEAYDNNSVAGSQVGVSAARYITVHSPTAKHYALSERLHEAIELLLTALADRLEAVWRGAEPPPLPDRISALGEVTQKAASAFAGIVEDMTDDPLTPEEVRLGLAGRLGALEKAMAAEERYADGHDGALRGGVESAVDTAARNNNLVVDEIEQSIILIEAMVARLALEDMAALTDELQAARERLKDLVQQLKANPESEALKARVMRDLHRLRDRMREIRERMAALRKKLPQEFLNIDGLKKDELAKGLKQTEDQLDQIEKMLEEGKIDEALAMMDEMERMLSELSDSLNNDMQDLHGESNPALAKAISELMDQARDLKRRQEALGQKTEQEQEKTKDQLERCFEEPTIAGLLKRAREDGATLRGHVERIEPRALHSVQRDDLLHLQQRSDELNSALERRRLSEAIEVADRARDHLGDLNGPGYRRPREAASLEAVERGAETVERVVGTLAELTQRVRECLEQAADQQQMQQLAQDQNDLKEAAEQLRQRVERKAQEVPGLSVDKPMERIEKAGQSMQQAAGELRRGNAGRSRPGQQRAVSELDGMLQELKKANQPKPAQRGQQKQKRMDQKKVEIPTEYEAPAEFRKELLDAMKHRPTEGFGEQVKRYYESLVE